MNRCPIFNEKEQQGQGETILPAQLGAMSGGSQGPLVQEECQPGMWEDGHTPTTGLM